MDAKYSNLCGIEPNVTCGTIGKLVYFVIKNELHLPAGAYHVVFANEEGLLGRLNWLCVR